MGASDAWQSGERPRITVAEWERLNRPPRREALLRYYWRTFRFLRTSAPVSELQGRQQSFRDAVVATVAFNRPDVIAWQIHLVRRHLAEHESYIVFDNSKKEEAREAIRDLCLRQHVPYVALPRNRLTVSRSHGQALNWIVRNFMTGLAPKVFGFIDHDIFPTEPFSIRDRLKGKSVYGSVRRDTPTPGGWFLWPAFCFFDGSLLRQRLDFAPSYKFRMDSGGGNWPLLYRTIDQALVRFTENKLLRCGEGDDEHEDFFMSVDGWLHVTNASNWRRQPVDRREQLVALLRQAAGPDHLDVKFEPI
ncbi:hypothetical protein FJ872_05405 [Mesorhizobium sp. B2-5-9]|uniref:hypothetical protein n=1 Tax=unclassified Mesorhizobium TaxID=325217 RepID=UPI0011264F22|nr:MULTISPECIES: hypothetical protein [unclassified Mesorhizobium]TPK23082.1 hypothetical protein FJ872_05405 [Mesorhizobium sp. B2-5-9]TPK87196.1 hypothetical protein FJ936_07590 [Mesorhizobium sp. B2-4-13]